MTKRLLSLCLVIALALALVCPAYADDSVDNSFVNSDAPFYAVLGFADEDSFDDFCVWLSFFPDSGYSSLYDYYLDSIYAPLEFDSELLDSLYSSLLSGVTYASIGNVTGISYYVGSGSTAVLQYTFILPDGGATGSGAATATRRVTLNVPYSMITGTSYNATLDFSKLVTTSTLTNYVTKSDLNSAGYVTTSQMNTAIANASSWSNADVMNNLNYLRQISYVLGYQSMDATSIWDKLLSIQTSNQTLANQFIPGTDSPFYFFDKRILSWDSPTNSSSSSSTMNGSILDLLRNFNNSSINQNAWGFNTLNSDLIGSSSFSTFYLDYQGNRVRLWAPNIPIAQLFQYLLNSISGLGSKISSFGSDSWFGFNFVDGYSLDGDSLSVSTSKRQIHNVVEALQYIYQDLQAPLFQLQQVLASDEDLVLRLKTQDLTDAVTDDFTGDGQAAPSTSDIGDMANISGDFSGMLDSGVGAGELVGVINGGDTYSFFSQSTADALDTTSSVAVISDDEYDPYEGYVFHEDLGVYVPDNPLIGFVGGE